MLNRISHEIMIGSDKYILAPLLICPEIFRRDIEFLLPAYKVFSFRLINDWSPVSDRCHRIAPHKREDFRCSTIAQEKKKGQVLLPIPSCAKLLLKSKIETIMRVPE